MFHGLMTTTAPPGCCRRDQLPLLSQEFPCIPAPCGIHCPLDINTVFLRPPYIMHELAVITTARVAPTALHIPTSKTAKNIYTAFRATSGAFFSNFWLFRVYYNV